ncbi:uncharacterized protein [Amphiura filiformis]|uniref:uncharacterized protein n=1 Tax=Amphiura filiformis TaxID=82378 RepID=UPI003B228A9D
MNAISVVTVTFMLLAWLHTTTAQDSCNPLTEFPCADGLSCVQQIYRCDFFIDCADNSDESDCACHSDTEFQCEAGGCIDIAWKCDDIPDCFDESDEAQHVCNVTTVVNECDSDPCQNGATCEDGVDSYTCVCTSGWTGDNCEQKWNVRAVEVQS